MTKRFLIGSLYGGWLGMSLAIIGFHFFTWQYYFVFIPTLMLVILKDHYE